jgi:outer membrane cobalamin receptor
MSLQTDTIKIKEVLISRRKLNSEQTGYKRITLDSLIFKNYSHNTLADLLNDNSKIFIKSYGLGGTATPSFRGTGASQTQITWNGLNINHPMLGQTDLSLIPAGLVDDIQIYFGGASMILNSGGIGGIINIETKPEWKNETLISLNPGIGSFGQYTGLIKVKTGNINFQSVTKAFVQSAENDFRYLNNEISSEPKWEIRKNSQVHQQGLMQELYYRRAKNTASIRIWYQSADRHLPESMLTQQSNSDERQFDESLKTMLNFNLFKGKNNYLFTGAWMLNKLNYLNTPASIDSRNLSETILLKTVSESKIGENTKMKITFDEEFDVIKSNNYRQNESRNTFSLAASVESNKSSRFGTMILAREIYNNKTFLIPDFTAGLQFRLFNEKEYFLKANFSRNSKIPTMNDLFWFPGGNQDLRNEYAFISELTYEMNQRISTALTFRYDVSAFRNSIKDMILWHPGEYSYWSADNIQYVNSTGVESSIVLDYKIKDFKYRFTAGYSFTKATNARSKGNDDISVGKQLMYIPEMQANTSLILTYRNFYSSWVANFTGRRYITVDNSMFLPGYFLNHISAGTKIKLKSNSLDMSFTIDNLFNVNYQAIAHYPLPGRIYSFKILIQIIK